MRGQTLCRRPVPYASSSHETWATSGVPSESLLSTRHSLSWMTSEYSTHRPRLRRKWVDGQGADCPLHRRGGGRRRGLLRLCRVRLRTWDCPSKGRRRLGRTGILSGRLVNDESEVDLNRDGGLGVRGFDYLRRRVTSLPPLKLHSFHDTNRSD